jgi:hypothetical protein
LNLPPAWFLQTHQVVPDEMVAVASKVYLARQMGWEADPSEAETGNQVACIPHPTSFIYEIKR